MKNQPSNTGCTTCSVRVRPRLLPAPLGSQRTRPRRTGSRPMVIRLWTGTFMLRPAKGVRNRTPISDFDSRAARSYALSSSFRHRYDRFLSRRLNESCGRNHQVEAAENRMNVVLGHHPGYLMLATKLGAQRFSVPGARWSAMTLTQRWQANRNFLARVVGRGDQIVFSHDPLRVRLGSSFFRELLYLRSRGVRIFPTQHAFVP